MKRILYVIIAALVCSVMASGAIAQWTDDFETYGDNERLPIPPWVGWRDDEEVPGQNSYFGIGYGDPKSVGIAKDESWFSEFANWRAFATRAADPSGNDYPIVTLTGKVILQNLDAPSDIRAQSLANVGAVGNIYVYDGAHGNAWWAGNVGTDSLNMQLRNNSDRSAVLMYYQQCDWKFDALGAQWSALRITHSSADGKDLELETWYDVKVEIDYVAGTAQAFYKRSGTADPWTVIDGLVHETKPDIWHDYADNLPIPLVEREAGNYTRMINVGVSARWNAVIDDVDVAVELPPLGDIDLTVNLTDYSGDLSLMRMTIELRDSGGGLVASREIAPGSTSVAQEFVGLVPGTFSISVAAPKWLTQTQSGIAAVAYQTTPVVIDLLNGDGDGDNTVDDADINMAVSSLDDIGE